MILSTLDESSWLMHGLPRAALTSDERAQPLDLRGPAGLDPEGKRLREP